MEREIGFFIFAILLGVVIVSAGHSDISTFKVNVLGPPPAIIKIQVPDFVFFENVSSGEESERMRVDINNTGNIDVIITPRLVDLNEEIFNYTYFTRRVSEPYQKIGLFSLNLSASSDRGGIESDYFYAKIDLREFKGRIDRDLIGHRTDVKFIAVAR